MADKEMHPGELRMESITVPRLPGNGVWTSGYSDGSDTCVHQSELEAYRETAGLTREVVFVRWGESFAEAMRRVDTTSREDTHD